MAATAAANAQTKYAGVATAFRWPNYGHSVPEPLPPNCSPW